METWYAKTRVKTDHIFQAIIIQVEEVFIKTSQIKWIFWDSANNQEAWKI